MSNPLAADVPLDQARDFVIRRAGAHQRLHVVLFDREEAIAQFPIRGQPKAIAVQAEGAAHRRNESDPTCVIGTAVVDGLGNWRLDKVGVTGAANPKAGTTVWKVAPTFIRAFSTLPSLGGTAAIDIVFK